MISKIRDGSVKRKVKIFILLLTSATLALFVSKLSESYINSLSFKLEFVNIPSNLLLLSASKNTATIKLEGNGFLFLRSSFKKKLVTLDLGEIRNAGNTFFLTASDYRKQIENQLQKSVVVLDMDRDTIFFNVDSIYSKSIEIIPKIELDLAQNFLLEGKLRVEPKEITVTGPKHEIDTLKRIYTERKSFSDLSSDFEMNFALKNPKNLKNTWFSTDFVRISGKISKFSEVLISIPVEVINLPKGVEIRTFPSEVSVLCKAQLEHLKELKASDFKIVADYKSLEGKSEIGLMVELVEKPDFLLSTQVMENEVEYILKRN